MLTWPPGAHRNSALQLPAAADRLQGRVGLLFLPCRRWGLCISDLYSEEGESEHRGAGRGAHQPNLPRPLSPAMAWNRSPFSMYSCTRIVCPSCANVFRVVKGSGSFGFQTPTQPVRSDCCPTVCLPPTTSTFLCGPPMGATALKALQEKPGPSCHLLRFCGQGRCSSTGGGGCRGEWDLQAGAQELDDVAVVAGAQDEDLAPERLRVARLGHHRHLRGRDGRGYQVSICLGFFLGDGLGFAHKPQNPASPGHCTARHNSWLRSLIAMV